MNTPFELLLDLDRRARCFAGELPSCEKVKSYSRGVGFSLRGEHFVHEVLRVPEKLTIIPGVQPWVCGVANVRGRLLPIVDLGDFLGLEVSNSSCQKVLVIELGDLFCGLLVDEVTGMQHFDEGSYSESVPIETVDVIRPFLAGSYRQDGEHLLFSLRALAGNEKFMQASLMRSAA